MESAVKEYFSTVESLLVFYQRASFRSQQVYTVLSALLKSNVNYQFSCHCDIRYVGRTSKILHNKIKQHVPKSIRSGSFLQKRILPPRHQCKSSTQSNIQALASDSAIALDSLQNLACAQHYDDSRFSILAQDRFPFHLSAIEATFITNSNPDLSRQKEFVHSLKISV